MRHQTLRRIQRSLVLISFVALLSIAVIAARVAGIGLPDVEGLAPQALVPAAYNDYVVLISGHAGSDSGAICSADDGTVLLTEAEINARIADLVARRLRRAGAKVEIFEEFDPRLENLSAQVLVSLHADSCIDASGYKAAHATYSAIPDADARLVACIEQEYAVATGLAHHINSVTHDMTRYHAFRRIDPATPAAILEMGFLGGDQALLTQQPQAAAQGIADSILCFLSQPTTD